MDSCITNSLYHCYFVVLLVVCTRCNGTVLRSSDSIFRSAPTATSLIQNKTKGHTGTEFVVMFQPYYNDTNFAQLVITSDVKEDFKVDIQSPFSGVFQTVYRAQNVAIVNLPPSILDLSAGSNMNGIKITSDHPISVVGLLGLGPYSTEAFMALPTDKLDKQYYIATHKRDMSETQTIGIVSLFDNTEVTISASDKNDMFLTNLNYTISAGRNYSITLGYLDTFYFESMDDITGTIVESNKEIAVYDGLKLTGLTYNYQTKTYSENVKYIEIEQLPPKSGFANEFIIPLIIYSSALNIQSVSVVPFSKIYTYLDNVFTVNQEKIVNKISVNSPKAVSIACKDPLLVTLHVSMYYRSRASYFSVNVPAISQFSNHYVISAPSLNITYENFVSIIIKSNDVGGLRFDGHIVTPVSEIDVNYENQLYKTLVLRLSPTYSHIIGHISQGVVFGAIVYGVGDGYAYGYSAGAEF